MKKLITILLIAMFAMIALTACGNDEPTNENVAPINENVVEEEINEPASEIVPEPTPEPISGIEMPDLRGQNVREARHSLLNSTQLNLNIEFEEINSSEERGIVVQTDPTFGTIINNGDIIIIYFSDGAGNDLSDSEIRELWNNFEEVVIDYDVDEEMVIEQWILALDEISELIEKSQSGEITNAEFEVQFIEINNTTLNYFKALFNKHNNPFLSNNLHEILSDYLDVIMSAPQIRDNEGRKITVFSWLT